MTQDDVDHARRDRVTGNERKQLRSLKAKNKRVQQDNETLHNASTFFAGELDPPQPIVIGFIDQMRINGHAVDSTWRG